MTRTRSIRTWLFGTCLVMFLGMSLSIPAQAQPAGSYQQTCRSISIVGNFLSASCRDRKGKYRATSLDNVSSCVEGSIFNNNGALGCSYASIPQGSYRASCGSVSVDPTRDVLSAACRQIGGTVRNSTLAGYSLCWADINNVNGYLACDMGDNPGPSGTYRTTCRDRNLAYPILTASCMTFTRAFRATRLDLTNCGLPVQNSNGKLTCGAPSQPLRPLPATGFSGVQFRNCLGSRHAVQVYVLAGQSTEWRLAGTFATNYAGSVCEGGNLVPLAAGYNNFVFKDADCTNDCEVGHAGPFPGQPDSGLFTSYVILN